MAFVPASSGIRSSLERSIFFVFQWFTSGFRSRRSQSAYNIIKLSESNFCKVFTDIFCQKPEEGDKVIGFALKSFSELGILCGHTDRTCIQMAFSHHDTTQDNQGGRCKTEFLSSKQSA